ncbi:ribosomal protein S18-alanine N-acetyltransferase [Fredinandcohnia quinoae]|uniref:[Ribosomal protein bS18]-alanine N-acetyltransferase n=1 Tax=Fredinandcohnia quinoae TaxID=2918902 RepID=A0AAW5ECM0_9BACI|nr:ribosomal protein S18-alanine N-acetyltransferase [Fredinandcohnia sp. SECRCQ15]MCH1627445.1 ribosomal protein S18-alanine N-acetyltransferase [Fredinandcohnia sp. SECRCQ15]
MTRSILFRFMTLDDIDGVVEVENTSFTVPWSKEAFYNELLHNQFAKYIVMTDGDRIIGYCGMWLIVDEAHITNIAVLPEYRGMKLGEALLMQAKILAMQHRAITMTLEVRVSNIVAQSLYKKLGFQAGGIRKNYYTDNQEDALVMWVNLNE